MSKGSKRPLKITDLTFRDGHQSLFATRMRDEDMEAIAETVGKIGYHALEVWGGATFDTMHRFLGEDPWERPKKLRKFIPKEVKFQMLLRGQNLVAYRNFADDVVDAFVEEACEAGIDIFRIFDALNDERNIERAAAAVKRCGKHFQPALSYTVTEGRMGGPIFTKEYWVGKAKTFTSMGADSICIKDMAGLLGPDDAYELVKAIKKATDIPLELHCHTTSGLAEYTFLRAIDAGVDILDTCSAPFAGRTSHPAIEPIVLMLQGTERDTGLDPKLLLEVADYLEAIAPKYRHLLDTTRLAVADPGVLLHQVPGGMLSNLVNQLRQADAEDKLQAVFDELPRVRQELGYPPLVTPTSQIVGVQAVQNVLFGKPGSMETRYKMISGQVKDYCYGLYGRPPVPIDPQLLALALKGYGKGEQPITSRPADVLEPELARAEAEVGDLARDRKDLLLYVQFPTTGKRFLEAKYGRAEAPAEWRARTLEDAKAEEEVMKKALSGELTQKAQKQAPPKGPNARLYRVYVDGEYFEVEVESVGGAPVVTGVAPGGQPASSVPAPQPARTEAPAQAPAAAVKGSLQAPMPGMVIDCLVKPGDPVKMGDIVLILEAMKMENGLEAPVDGVVQEVLCKKGDSVAKDAKLLTIG
jgi:pyruvate carboxylase subunit B